MAEKSDAELHAVEMRLADEQKRTKELERKNANSLRRVQELEQDLLDARVLASAESRQIDEAATAEKKHLDEIERLRAQLGQRDEELRVLIEERTSAAVDANEQRRTRGDVEDKLVLDLDRARADIAALRSENHGMSQRLQEAHEKYGAVERKLVAQNMVLEDRLKVMEEKYKMALEGMSEETFGIGDVAAEAAAPSPSPIGATSSAAPPLHRFSSFTRLTLAQQVQVGKMMAS